MRDDLPSLGVSTFWNVGRTGGLLPAVEEILALGVGLIEAAAPAGAADAPAAAARLLAARARCAAIAFPLLSRRGASEDRLDLGDPDPERRVQAARAARQTAAQAADFRCRVIIIRGSRIPADRADDHLAEIARALESGDVAALGRKREEILAARLSGRDAALDRLCRALHAFMRVTPGIQIAIAPSTDLFMTPDERELALLFDDLRGQDVAYWHSSGVCAVRERLGLAGSAAFLSAHAAHCAGAYLSDSSGLLAGLPPGAGRVDWLRERELLPAGIPRILKLDPRSNTLAIREGLKQLA